MVISGFITAELRQKAFFSVEWYIQWYTGDYNSYDLFFIQIGTSGTALSHSHRCAFARPLLDPQSIILAIDVRHWNV